MKSRGILALGLSLVIFALGLVAVSTAKPYGGDGPFVTTIKAHTVLMKDGKLMAQEVSSECLAQREMLLSATDRTNGQFQPAGALEGKSAKALLVNLEAPAGIINSAERVEVYRTTAVDGRPAFVVVVYGGDGCGIGLAVIAKPVK